MVYSGVIIYNCFHICIEVRTYTFLFHWLTSLHIWIQCTHSRYLQLHLNYIHVAALTLTLNNWSFQIHYYYLLRSQTTINLQLPNILCIYCLLILVLLHLVRFRVISIYFSIYLYSLWFSCTELEFLHLYHPSLFSCNRPRHCKNSS